MSKTVARARRFLLMKKLLERIDRIQFLGEKDLLEDDEVRPGRWYNAGLERTCEMLCGRGYEIVESDVGSLIRDPIVHFRKPR